MLENNQYSNVPLDSILETYENKELYFRFLDENILVKRDPKSNSSGIFGYTEVVNFTFDEFRDFLISHYLVEELYLKSEEDFKKFISENINSESQILEGCGTFLFHVLRESDDEKLRGYVYKEEWFEQTYIKSIFTIDDSNILEDDKKRISKYYFERDLYCNEIVNNLVKRADPELFENLNIDFLIELVLELDEENYKKKFLNVFTTETRHYRFNNQIPLWSHLDKLKKKYRDNLSNLEPKGHKLFNVLLLLFKHEKNWEILNLYEEYTYLNMEMAKKQITLALKAKNIVLTALIKAFCKEYDIEL